MSEKKLQCINVLYKHRRDYKRLQDIELWTQYRQVVLPVVYLISQNINNLKML